MVLALFPVGKDREMILRWIEPRARRAEAKVTGEKVKPRFAHKKATGALAKADAAFSKYIRTRDTTLADDGNRYGACVTYGKFLSMDQLQCGHFIPRGKFGTRFNVENAHAQCPRCNDKRFGNGEIVKHAAAIRLRHGNDAVERLEKQAAIYPQRPMDEELLEFAEIFLKQRGLEAARGMIGRFMRGDA
jgi:hypothetical protein